MDNTKVYIVERTGYGSMYGGMFGGHSAIEEVYFSKIQAEFAAWKLDRKKDGRFIYTIAESTLGTLETKGKDFIKFIGEKVNKVKSDLESEREKRDGSMEVIKSLKEDLETLGKLIEEK